MVIKPELDCVRAPIGVFDSGFGGLTVARAVSDLLPYEDIVYLGDSAREPYGPRPIAEVREFALQALDKLVAHGVKALVIACNSASSAVLRDARERYSVPIVEVILPAAKKALATSRNKRIGVVCTQATATSRSYDDALEATEAHLVTAVAPQFVDFVEQGITTGREITELARDYLAPLVADGIDTLILGCTHYPLLAGVISYVMGDDVTLVSSSDECARQLFQTLTRRELLYTAPRIPQRLFLTTGDPAKFEGLGSRLMGGLVEGVQRVRL